MHFFDSESIRYIIGLIASYYLLNRNLIRMVMLANDRSKIYLFNASQNQFMQTVTKLSVLISLFTVAVILYVIVSLIDYAVGPNPISESVVWIVYALTVVLGTLSIFLSFHFNLKVSDPPLLPHSDRAVGADDEYILRSLPIPSPFPLHPLCIHSAF